MPGSTFPRSSRNRVEDYFQDRARAIQLCFDQGEPEACLTLVYSGIDTFGFLGAPAGIGKATRTSFLTWADAYLVGRLNDIFQGRPVTAIDLYAARCGILHTSTSESDLGNRGEAREIFYRYRKHQAIRLPALMEPFIAIEIEHLCMAFQEGALSFIEALESDTDRAQRAKSRAEGFMRWGVPVTDEEASQADGETTTQ